MAGLASSGASRALPLRGAASAGLYAGGVKVPWLQILTAAQIVDNRRPRVNLSAEGTISATANCIGCVLLRGRRRRSSHFEGSGQNLTRSVAAAESAAAWGRWACPAPERASLASAARMRVQVQVGLAPLPETPLYKAI